MSVLIIVEHDNRVMKPNTLNMVHAAKALQAPIHLLVAGVNIGQVAEEAASIEGIEKVISVDDAKFEHALPEALASLIADVASSYQHVLMPASTFGKNVLPRVGARLDVAQISDVTEILDSKTFKHPIYAGNAIETVESQDGKVLMTVRTTAFDRAALGSSKPIETYVSEAELSPVKFVKLEASTSDRPDLTSARVVISGGRALQSSDNFKMIEALADKLQAAVGASRAAVDAGYVPNDYQVGQTGKIVAPDLYIAIGISGAIQHVAGMKDSKVIVAINKDPDAPIFQIADYGLEADLFEAVPRMIELL